MVNLGSVEHAVSVFVHLFFRFRFKCTRLRVFVSSMHVLVPHFPTLESFSWPFAVFSLAVYLLENRLQVAEAGDHSLAKQEFLP